MICFEVFGAKLKNQIFCKHVVFSKSQKTISTSYWSKKAYLLDKIFVKTLKTLLWGIFKLAKPSSSELIFKNCDASLFLLYDTKLHGIKIYKKLMTQISCIADKWRNEQNQIYRALRLRWVSIKFSHRVADKDHELPYGGPVV